MQTSASNEKETSRGDGLRYEYAGALPVYRFERLNGDTALIHAVFTRRGGVSVPPYASLNLGHTVGDNPEAVEINHDRVYRALGVPRARVATCHLTHSADVLPVGSSDGGRVVGQGDAMVTADADVYLGMRFADCAPILLHDPLRRVVGLAHAGWRGTVKNVAGAVVKTMVNQLACSPQNIVAVIGPAIGPCCYQVGEDVIQAVEGALPWRVAPHHGAPLFSRHNGRHAYFDLWEANRQQLEAAGVGRVVVSGVCTACRTDHFFSHRAERGRTGRFGVMIGYRG
jgi:YfiH family protein